MGEIVIPSGAQLALVKLLVRLQLVPPEATKQYVSDELCPIAFFARLGMLDESKAIQRVAQHLGIEVFSFRPGQADGPFQALNHPKLGRVEMEKWRMHRVLPIAITDRRLTLAAANPLDVDGMKSLEFDLGYQITTAIAPEELILSLLSRKDTPQTGFSLDEILSQSEAEAPPSILESMRTSDAHVGESEVNAAPVVKLVNKVLSDAVQRGASDLHISPERDGLMVRVRVDGIMQPLFTVPSHLAAAVLSRLKVLSGMDIAERRKPQDGRLRVKVPSGTRDLRVSTVPTAHGENLVARILASDLQAVDFDALGMSAPLQADLKSLLQQSSRLFLVTGPTGSGKTSTLYGCLLAVRDGSSNIISIEDPIEYRIPGVTQVQVNPKIGVTFAEGLRSVLRQDPDVVMVGEIRDGETASVAMQVAQTGHLVLSTLHTTSAAGAVTRLRDLGVPAFVIAASLGGVLAQRLVRRLCSACARPLSAESLARAEALALSPHSMREAGGCPECFNSGYRGRLGVFSFLAVTDALREAIRNEASEADLQQIARGGGFISLEEAARDAVNAGLTSLDEVERAVGALPVIASPVTSYTSVTGKVATPTGLTRPKVLLIDDDEDTREVLAMVLQREFYDVIQAANGIEGLERVFDSPPDIIICDLMMPKMNGAEFLQRLQRDARTRQIPVLMLTAAGTAENEVLLLAGGASDFVAKGADTKVMLARLSRLLSA